MPTTLTSAQSAALLVVRLACSRLKPAVCGARAMARNAAKGSSGEAAATDTKRRPQARVTRHVLLRVAGGAVTDAATTVDAGDAADTAAAAGAAGGSVTTATILPSGCSDTTAVAPDSATAE